MKEAQFYQILPDGKISCRLCPHFCVLTDGKSGICGARKAESGKLVSLNYGIISGMSFDPIEKKPLYHYFPGSEILSIGTVGCNLHCPFCQNYSLSRYFEEENISLPERKTPADVLALFKGSVYGGNVFKGIAYTYSEPVVWYEFVKETAVLLKESGGKNVLVTNGFINPQPLADILPLIDAANVDLKAFTEPHYQKLGGKLAPVLKTIESMQKAGVHVELTTLVVTGLNDTIEEIEASAKWIASISKKIPLHLSRYFPRYQYNEPATEAAFLEEARLAAKTHLDYVYVGNMHGESSTLCPSCGNLLIERLGYETNVVGISDNQCKKCGNKTDIILN